MSEKHAAVPFMQWIPSTNDVIDFILEQTNKYSEQLHIIVPTGAIMVLAGTVFYTCFIQKNDPRLDLISDEIRDSHAALDRIVESIQLLQVAESRARNTSTQNSTNISLSLREHQEHKIKKSNLDPTNEADAAMLDKVSESIRPVEEILRIPDHSKFKNDQPIVPQVNNPTMETDSEYSKCTDRSNERLVSHHLLDGTSNLGDSETLDANATILRIAKKMNELPDQKKRPIRNPFVKAGMFSPTKRKK